MEKINVATMPKAIFVAMLSLFLLLATMISVDPYRNIQTGSQFLFLLSILLGISASTIVRKLWLTKKGFAIKLASLVVIIFTCLLLSLLILAKAKNSWAELIQFEMKKVSTMLDDGYNGVGIYPSDILPVLITKDLSKNINRIYYYSSSDGYLLATPGLTLDMDGETMFYSSKSKTWRTTAHSCPKCGTAYEFREATKNMDETGYARNNESDWKRLKLGHFLLQ